MKKENTNEIFQREVTEHLMNVIFEKPVYTANTPEEQLLKHKRSFGLKVQSVALPKEHELFTLKSENKVINWMQNKIYNIHTAFYKINSKYDNFEDKKHWRNNKIQNQRFLETKNMYKDKED